MLAGMFRRLLSAHRRITSEGEDEESMGGTYEVDVKASERQRYHVVAPDGDYARENFGEGQRVDVGQDDFDYEVLSVRLIEPAYLPRAAPRPSRPGMERDI